LYIGMCQTLSDFMAANKISYTAFGRLIGVTGPAVENYVKGRRTPRPAIMARIRAVTGGAVVADHFTPPDSAPIGFESALPARPP
jgi:DNA-binding transcriptional regulator YdaS (Cro superfamily)